jgi:hypothetical protein
MLNVDYHCGHEPEFKVQCGTQSNAICGEYPVIKIGSWTTGTITIFPSFDQVVEMYKILGDYIRSDKNFNKPTKEEPDAI